MHTKHVKTRELLHGHLTIFAMHLCFEICAYFDGYVLGVHPRYDAYRFERQAYQADSEAQATAGTERSRSMLS